MEQNKKLTREELDEIKEIQVNIQNITFTLGTIQIQTLSLESQKAEVLKTLEETNLRDKEFGEILFEKYGKGKIDFEKGEFIKVEETNEEK